MRPIERARIWARTHDQAIRAARKLTYELGIEVAAAQTPDAAVEEADIIVTATPSTEPILLAKHVNKGVHITAMGSDADHKNELEPAILSKADLYVCDRQSQCAALGELRSAIEAGLIDPARKHREIGEIVAGEEKGRVHPDQITVCDQTGTGVQDTAIATLTRERCEAARIGTEFES